MILSHKVYKALKAKQLLMKKLRGESTSDEWEDANAQYVAPKYHKVAENWCKQVKRTPENDQKEVNSIEASLSKQVNHTPSPNIRILIVLL